MSYNKKQHLKDNIEAIKLAFIVDREERKPSQEELDIIRKYSGFGGLKCILNPAETLIDVLQWNASESDLFALTSELHELIKNNSATNKEYEQYIRSLKNSVLTAFYTPPEITEVIAQSLKDNGITAGRFLDPSAGMGQFMNSFQSLGIRETVSFEKELLTSKLLAYSNPDYKVFSERLEMIDRDYINYFDIVSSNIPFGDTKVFDPVYFGSQNPVHQQAIKNVHSYFFVKSVDISGREDC